jgi:hypothetical protein
MSRMLIRPPAKMVSWERQKGLSGRQNYAAVDQVKNYENVGRAGSEELRPWLKRMQIVWMDMLQINPAHSQPNLIYYSGAQPFIRTGHMRRWTRTFMSASPRFFGRAFYVGLIERQYTERARITGVPTRLGTTYAYPRFRVAPRAVQLAGGSSDQA